MACDCAYRLQDALEREHSVVHFQGRTLFFRLVKQYLLFGLCGPGSTKTSQTEGGVILRVTFYFMSLVICIWIHLMENVSNH